MKKFILAALLIFGFSLTNYAQKLYSDNAIVSLESTTPRDTILAENKSGSFELDLSTNKIKMTAQVKDFVIENKVIDRFKGKSFMEVEKFQVFELTIRGTEQLFDQFDEGIHGTAHIKE